MPLDVLVVDDNPVNQKVAVAVLTKWGHRSVVACDGPSGLAAFDQQRFDLVLMDIQMPIMDGIEVILRIRAREAAQGGHVPIIAVTAHAANQDRTRCLEAGADRYLTKPLDLDLLRRTIAELSFVPTAGPLPLAEIPAAAAVNFENLKEYVGDDPALLLEIVQAFLDDTPTALENTARAIELEDARALETSAHRLKGSLLTMGANIAAKSASQLEVMGREGMFVGAAETSVRLSREIREASECLRQWAVRQAA